MKKMSYRLALDLGSTSLGWAMLRLDTAHAPCAVIKAGVRIFSDGRNPKDGSSLAVTRREARAMRRRRDRLLKRKARMMKVLVEHGFFPQDPQVRKALERLDPLALRAKGLNEALQPEEFARALFHINQRRGFKSNRKTDKKDNDSGALKQAIRKLSLDMQAEGSRTVGEWLFARHQKGQPVRARYRESRIVKDDGKTKIDKSYDLYIDRAMIEAEFDALWSKQNELNPRVFHEAARADLKDCLLHQRPLKPVKPGRCTLMSEEERAPLALPSQQRFRIYQEVNHLRMLQEGLSDVPLTLQQRDQVVQALESNAKRTFDQIRRLLGFSGTFNLEDDKRTELKGNVTSAVLSKKELFGRQWMSFAADVQDQIVLQLLTEENETRLVTWLQETTGVDEVTATRIADTQLAEGYGSLSAKALEKILPELQRDVITYDKAVKAAGFEHHSRLNAFSAVEGLTFDTGIERIDPATGEIRALHAFKQLPYYGEHLQRHVGFGTGRPEDPPEKRFGKIANPTVHIGLNQVRVVVNALIERYGHPSEVIVEVARDLKQNWEQRKEDQKRQAQNQKRNQRMREQIGLLLNINPDDVKGKDVQKMILWEELNRDNASDRRCPYSGAQISAAMLFSDQVEIEHILPFSQTLDDSLNNKTVAMRQANRIKGNRTPWEARHDFAAQGWATADMLVRAENMPKNKRYRFGENGLEQWLRDDKDFLARALNDTRYLSRVAREYLSLICPQDTRVIPGQMTAMLRAKFGLNDILGLDGEKNRNDHRHHAVDACVIAATDQGLLQRFASASASARERQLDKLVDTMPMPWPTYREHVQRAVERIWVSHKPDHGHEGGMMEDTSYKPPHLDVRGRWHTRGIGGANPNDRAPDAPMIAIQGFIPDRHQRDQQGDFLPYKGYVGGSNYCIEITRDDTGRWRGNVITTYQAYVIEREQGLRQLRNPRQGQNGAPLVMRLVIDDVVKMKLAGDTQLMRFVKVSVTGQMTFAPIHEANVDKRHGDKSDPFVYTTKYAGSLQDTEARRVTISRIGEVRDPGSMN